MLHAERAKGEAKMCGPLAVFEEAFEYVTRAASVNKPSGYSSEDDTCPNKLPDSELCSVVNACKGTQEDR